MRSETDAKLISLKDVEYVMGENFPFFGKVVKNVFCMCQDNRNTEIVDYQIFLTKRRDILLRGSCAHCGHEVARLIETGDSEEKRKRADKILKSK